jgi:hypothetical protein
VERRAPTITDASPRAPDITGLNEPSDEEARPEPETRHRFHREQDDGRPHARRLIVHRDRRHGRPKKKKGAGRTDPARPGRERSDDARRERDAQLGSARPPLTPPPAAASRTPQRAGWRHPD